MYQKSSYYAILLLILSACHPQWRESSSGTYQHLPALDILLPDSNTILNTAAVPGNRPTIIFYFDPTCEKCRDMTAYLMNHFEAIRNATTIFVSFETLTAIRQFSKRFNLSQHSNIIVGADYQYKLLNKFKITSLPEIIIYNDHGELTKLYKGEVYIDQIVKALNS